MFARSAFRACQSAQPARHQIRRYADKPASSPSSGGSSLPYFLGGGAVLAGAYYYFTQNPGAAQKAEASVKDALPASVGGVKKALTGGDQGFVSLKLDDVETVNHNTKKFRFKLPEDDMVSGIEVTSALLTKFKADGAEKPVLRPYTPVSDEDEKGFMDLIVKKYEGGPMSTHLHDMVPGQRLDFKGPLPKYPWNENKHEHIALIAGGTGITPMYQLCRAIFKNPNDKTKVTLVYGNVGEDDILLKKEFQELENTYPQRFRAFYLLDNPPKEWKGGKGFITKELLKTVLPEPKSGDIKVFVCGPPGLYKAISGNKVSPKDQGELTGVLAELGYNKDQVYKF
ncbi:NADH-cytochrome b5 reductase 2 [Cytospora mali]|uniref:NADH-cytochrome b5 reductase n=1 Tax=Cytospora mali TaxID=578113 RepID=A0A194V2M7_CYTMA|nr:NADH-cytochrome b5 reductase 2 [Valsa mali var. pyri (nom. inval.)]